MSVKTLFSVKNKTNISKYCQLKFLPCMLSVLRKFLVSESLWVLCLPPLFKKTTIHT